ncbi:MAG: 3-dehydroquinate synthase family protein [Acidimicrobiales bacterium]
MRIPVALGERAYDVVVADGARHELAGLLGARAPRARVAALVTSDALRAEPWFDLVSGLEQVVISVPDGEAAKSLTQLEALLERLALANLSREDVVVAVGGGAVCDLAGFAASVYRRGVGVVHVATSLVAQVDAAVGGKNGVNLRAGKNLAGTFYQPWGVLCDTEVLASLPEREVRNGLAEVAKCWLIEGRPARAVAATPRAALVEAAVALKARVVASDEREGGPRAVLNYGHTLAHALEALARTRGDDVRHGEAVATGLWVAARLARALGRIDEQRVAYHDAVLAAFGLDPWSTPAYEPGALLEVMARDKKAHHDLTFVLDGPHGIETVPGLDAGVVREVLERFEEER